MPSLERVLKLAVGVAKTAVLAAVILPPVTLVLVLCCRKADVPA